jgi:hypothetical protein
MSSDHAEVAVVLPIILSLAVRGIESYLHCHVEALLREPATRRYAQPFRECTTPAHINYIVYVR